MSDVASPKNPPYRMTLSYGPEPDGSASDMVYCVFNVKKRNWKGGVQVAVEMSQAQIAHIRERFRFDQWLRTFLVHLPESEREDCLVRGQDIFIQQVYLIKLQLAIGVGIQQENTRVPKDFLVAELNEALGEGRSGSEGRNITRIGH